MLINILGLDPSMSNWGISNMVYDTNKDSLSLVSVDVIRTSINKESKESKAKQDINRCLTLLEGINNYLNNIDIIVIELPIGSQSANAAKSYGICIALSAYLSQLGITTLYVSPFDVKRVIGKTNTSKGTIIDWVNSNHPNILSKQKYLSEHEADATVAIYAALNQIKEL